MLYCSDNHSEVCFDDDACPACEIRAEAEEEIKRTELEINRVREEVSRLQEALRRRSEIAQTFSDCDKRHEETIASLRSENRKLLQRALDAESRVIELEKRKPSVFHLWKNRRFQSW